VAFSTRTDDAEDTITADWGRSSELGQRWLDNVGCLLRLKLARLAGETGRKASDALLELAVLGGVDERVDAAVGDHQNHGEVVEPELPY